MPSTSRTSSRGVSGSRQLQADPRLVEAPGREPARRRSDVRLRCSPAEMEGELGGAAGAVQAQVRGVAVGVEVVHGHLATSSWHPAHRGRRRTNRPSAPREIAAPAPGADRLRRGSGRGLGQRQEVVAAARDLEERGHWDRGADLRRSARSRCPPGRPPSRGTCRSGPERRPVSTYSGARSGCGRDALEVALGRPPRAVDDVAGEVLGLAGAPDEPHPAGLRRATRSPGGAGGKRSW